MQDFAGRYPKRRKLPASASGCSHGRNGRYGTGSGSLGPRKSDYDRLYLREPRDGLRDYLVKAQRYLTKPLDQEEMLEALLYCHVQWQQDKKEILLPTDKGQYRISCSGIQFVETMECGSRFILTDEAVETKLRISRCFPRPVLCFATGATSSIWQ